VSNETEDPSGEPGTDDAPAAEDTTEATPTTWSAGPMGSDDADATEGSDGGEGPEHPAADDADGYDDEPDWQVVLAQVSRDTALTQKLVGVLIVVVVVAAVVLGILIRTNDTSSSTATATPKTTTTTTAPALESVAGQPCVALADPLPTGAPPMDIDVGPAPTTLVIKDIKEGTGATATATSTVSVNYVGVACSTGKIFDASYSGGTTTPASIPLAQVIPGFAQGITGMKVGGQRLIGIPSDLAYGAEGGGTTIAPDEALWFVVELTAVTP
jgi:peptidylprolyl isomerase